MTELPTISAQRLRLRQLRHEDAEDLFAVFSDREVVRYWSRPPLADVAAASAMIGRIIKCADEGSLLQWGVVRIEDDRVIGTCTLADIDLDHLRASVGYALRRSVWGQGLAREAVRVMIGFAFEVLGLHRLAADCDPRNAASLRLLDELGFVREGVARECYFVVDEWQDSVQFGLLRREWGAAA